MCKRAFDIFFSAFGLLATSPILLGAMLAVWLQDFHSPFYIATRTGRNGHPFKMVKLRSMVMNADKAGVDSTSANDKRITVVGKFIRACKLDELSQLWNVLTGDMSLVGPRPNVPNETARYTAEENFLLAAKPGITDIASIVFSDEGAILADSADPDLDYNRLIRPWKSRLGILYIKHRSIVMDFKLVVLTAVAIVSKPLALKGVDAILASIDAPEDVRIVARRDATLEPAAPPGADRPVIAADLYGEGAAA
jgi:lipopolysaccharide/colanic/teichoic acid biosynthesis glycosyltransferase